MNDDSIDFFESVFCVREINRIEDYLRFRRTRVYVRVCSALVPDAPRAFVKWWHEEVFDGNGTIRILAASRR